MKQPLISIIIPVYNRSETVGAAIESVLEQTYRHYEIIIVDDGSTDATAEALKAYADRATVITREHSGPSAARNSGIGASHGEYIALLDSDDIWLPKKLETQVSFFLEHPEIKVCQTEEIWLRNGVRVNPMKKHKKHSGWIFKQCLPLCIVSPSAVMVHKSVFQHVGLFDETMQACEDYDLWLRIAPHYAIYLIEEPLIVKHGGHPDQQSRTVPNLDKLRIKALCKILEEGALSTDLRTAAHHELEKKCRIYGNGCLKHGKETEGNHYKQLPGRYA